MVSNHLTNFDWLFIIIALKELGTYEELCIIIKDSLLKLPIYGYGMKCFGYIFFKKRMEKRSQYSSRRSENLKNKKNFYLLFFPEGIILDQETQEK